MDKIRIVTRQVEQFRIDHPDFDKQLVLDRDDAQELYDRLATALGQPQISLLACDNRYSHGPHVEIKKDGIVRFCKGRSQDAT